MKRSRNSRYDKKRPRDKKDSKRKFTFSTKSSEKNETPEKRNVSEKRSKDTRSRSTYGIKDKTSPKASTHQQPEVPKEKKLAEPIDHRVIDFEVYSKEDKKYQQRETHHKKKNSISKITWPIAVIAILFLIRFVSNIGDDRSSDTNDIPNNYNPVYQERGVKTPPKKIQKINAANFIVGDEKPLREVTQLEKDSTITILPNVQVRLFKGFHIFDAEAFPSTPILASYSKYHFFHDVRDKVENQSITEQWSMVREELAESSYDGYFLYQYPKEYEFEDLLINETEFSISLKNHIIYGVATLIEHKNKRYFFQLISKERANTSTNYNHLKKYLDYYLKIE